MGQHLWRVGRGGRSGCAAESREGVGTWEVRVKSYHWKHAIRELEDTVGWKRS